MGEGRGKWSQLEVAIEGDGLSPRDVTVRQLAELLQATAAAVEAVAREQGVEPPDLRLIAVRDGSAAYDILSNHPDASQVFREFYRAAKTRGKRSGVTVRHALARMHHSSRIGSVRIVPRNTKGEARAKPVHLAPPLEEVETTFEAGTEVHGRIVGVMLGRGDRTTVRLRREYGATEDFEAETAVADAAAKLFGRNVVAMVTYEIGPDSATAGTIERVLQWDGADLLDVAQDIRNDLVESAAKIDVQAWLDELDEVARD